MKRQVAALQKKIDDQDKVAEVAALFKDSASSKSNNEEKHQDMARKVMGILAREKKDSCCLGCDNSFHDQNCNLRGGAICFCFHLTLMWLV